ncbi:MAG TPA: hypothetical protein VE258_16005 [Ktedonobacterales bacterium]|nr:hypothetical protein [Ktedonobacterales bacterium]
MFTLLRSSRRDDIVGAEDRVVLADGSVVVVPRANLAAAKALLAAQRAAVRRVGQRSAAERRQQEALAS